MIAYVSLVYEDLLSVPDDASAKYPKAVFTGESALYYYGLTDVIPNFYHLATVRADGRIKDGYGEANAEAKLCQDIIIKAISQSSLNRNVTIKGGVVMRSLSKNARPATQDLEFLYRI